MPPPGKRFPQKPMTTDKSSSSRSSSGSSSSSSGAAAAAEAAERLHHRTTYAVLLAHTRRLHTYASTHTQSKRKCQHSHTPEARTANILFAAAIDRPNSNGSTKQQRRRRGSGGIELLASAASIVLMMTPCLDGCALTYASARGVHTRKVNESLDTLHTAEATTAQ